MQINLRHMEDRKKKVMIVEDQQVLLDLYKEKFVLEGYEVLGCTNGLEAVTMLDSFRPDVILLDIMMPQMDGFETLRVIRKLAPTVRTKILIFSNLSGEEHVEKCMELGADGYVVKAETTPAEVVGKVDELIRIIDLCAKEPMRAASEQVICPCCGTTFVPTGNV